MISVADLIVDNIIPGNYFASDVYVRSELEMGLLENRRGDRLIAMPETLLQAIYSGLDKETGQASRMVLYNCGRWWGKNFYARFCEELSDYYKKPLAEMAMLEFVQCLQQCWQTHGWGKIDLDNGYHQQGFLVVKIVNSPFAAQAPQGDRPICFLDAGVVSAFFSQVTGKELECIQTSCESLGAECNQFVLGLEERLKPVAEMVENQIEHAEIMQNLVNG